MWNKIKLIWVLLGPEELVALAMFLLTLGVWAETIGTLHANPGLLCWP